MLATIFLSDHMLALGFLLVMVVPCSSMAIGYTGLSKGDLELATVVVALSFVLAIVAVPLWMTLFASSYQIAVPMGDLINSILTVLLAPMVLGYLTRQVLLRRLGQARFGAIGPLFPALSLLGMYSIVFLIFFGKAALILDRWQTVLVLLIPNAIFIGLSLLVLTWLDRRLHFGYAEHMAVAFTSTGKNNGTAIAIATTAFSPLVAIPAATMPIFQILLMVLYLRAAPRLRLLFEPHPAAAAPVTVPGSDLRPSMSGIAASPAVDAPEHDILVARAAPSWRLLVALVLAFGVLALEVGGGLLTGSLALLSDAAHVLVDIVAILVGLGAARLAARKPDANHTYGFHRLEAIGALTNAVLLIAASAVVFAESIGRLMAPSDVDAPAVLVIAIGSLAVNSTSALIVHSSERRTQATRALVLHLGGDALGCAGRHRVGPRDDGRRFPCGRSRREPRDCHRSRHRRLPPARPDRPPAQRRRAFDASRSKSASAAIHAVPGVRSVHDLHVWSIAEDIPVVTAHLETSIGADTRRILLTATEALRRVGVGHATLQLEHESCGQGRPQASLPPQAEDPTNG